MTSVVVSVLTSALSVSTVSTAVQWTASVYQMDGSMLWTVAGGLLMAYQGIQRYLAPVREGNSRRWSRLSVPSLSLTSFGWIGILTGLFFLVRWPITTLYMIGLSILKHVTQAPVPWWAIYPASVMLAYHTHKAIQKVWIAINNAMA